MTPEEFEKRSLNWNQQPWIGFSERDQAFFVKFNKNVYV